jgi:hypothetical protein
VRENPYENNAEIMAMHKMLLSGDFLREKCRFFGYVSCCSLKSSAHPPWGAPIQRYGRAPAREDRNIKMPLWHGGRDGSRAQG